MSDEDSETVDVGGGGGDFGGGGGDFGGGPDDADTQQAKKPKGPPRAPQQCNTCGHRRQQGSYE